MNAKENDRPVSKREALASDLLSTDPKRVMAALKRIPDQGEADMIMPLVQTRLAWPREPGVQAKIEKILKELKTEKAVPELIRVLEDPRFDSERAFVISLFWNAGLFPSDHFDVLIKHAIRGGYMVAFEVLTVLEHSDDQPDSEELQELILDVEEYLERNPEAEHTSVLVQILEVLQENYNI